jgi:acyl-CoA thioester hydrolase
MDEFRFTIPYRVRIADINYGGHVSNAAVLNYFQDARIAYLAHLGPFSELAVGNDCGLIMPEAQVRYLAEMFLGDELDIAVRMVELRQSALVMAYRITRGGEVTAEGTTALVVFDYQRRKARRIPQELRQAIERFEGA